MKSVCEEKNFQFIFNQNKKSLHNFIYYKSGDYNLAQDVTQESFLVLWNNCKTVIFESAKSYLFTVGTRLFLNIRRREKIELEFVKNTKLPVDQENPQFLMEENEFKIKLEKVISKLPEKQRVVFLLNRIDNMTYAEIANLLDISVKAVEKRMSSCLKNLKSGVIELKSRKI